jgi:hypothetical protein
VKERRLQTVKDGAGDCCADLKEEFSVVAELWKMRVQPVAPMPALNAEVGKKNMQIVIDSSVLALVSFRKHCVCAPVCSWNRNE